MRLRIPQDHANQGHRESMNRPNSVEADPRDQTRRPYLSDDNLNPAHRPTVQATINKINQLNIMQDPVNRRYILSRLLVELTIVDTAEIIQTAMAQFKRQLWSIPLFEDIVTQDVHDFDPLPSRKNPGKFLNKCKVCGNSKQHIYHRIPSE
jgi:hypothetical protein